MRGEAEVGQGQDHWESESRRLGYGHHSVISKNIHREPVTLLDAKGTHRVDYVEFPGAQG